MVLSLYELAWKPAAAMLRRTDPQVAHARTVALLRRSDDVAPLGSLARLANRYAFPDAPTRVGGVMLPHPLILAAGLVKGDGFPDETSALAAVGRHCNIVPGWRSLPALVGPVEFGSFTRHPRLGNAGRVLWRNEAARSMQNRVGLRNPGARAAASYLRSKARRLPASWGVNLAVSPGLDDLEEGALEVQDSASYFVSAFSGVRRSPSWYTLNLSCPNTADDPRAHQTEAQARRLCEALADRVDAPLWVKVGPDLSNEQLSALVRVFSDCGVRAVVATNTVARRVPGGSLTAGLSGAPLRTAALGTVRQLAAVIGNDGVDLDVVACGGIMRGADLTAFQAAGARAAMIYSALVFRGPLAAALILRESERRGRDG
ncbi:MAG: hypothetical protein ACC726_02070 [Chloroflexota bacterium]